MSVLINLLPDLRQKKLRERQRRRLATIISLAIWSVVVGVVLILGLYDAAQKLNISSLSSKITAKQTQLKNMSSLTDALTAEQNISALPSLYSKRVYLSKFFADYAAATPNVVTISSLGIDETNTLKVEGITTSYYFVTKLAAALAADNVTIGSGASATNDPYFTNISVNEVSKGGDGKTTFALTATVGEGVTSAQ